MNKLDSEIVAFLSDLVDSFSKDGEYNIRSAPLGLQEMRKTAASLIKRIEDEEAWNSGPQR